MAVHVTYFSTTAKQYSEVVVANERRKRLFTFRDQIARPKDDVILLRDHSNAFAVIPNPCSGLTALIDRRSADRSLFQTTWLAANFQLT